MYAIDRIEENIAICEHLKTKEIVEIPIYLLPPTITEGSIISMKNETYIHEKEIETKRKEELRNRLNRLKINKKGSENNE